MNSIQSETGEPKVFIQTVPADVMTQTFFGWNLFDARFET